MIVHGSLMFFNENTRDFESMILTEPRHQIISDLIVRISLIVIPILVYLSNPLFEEPNDKVVFAIVGILMILAGIVLLPESIKKLTNHKYVTEVELNQIGIKLSNTIPFKNGFFPWSSVNEIAIKVFSERFSNSPFLLFTTYEGKLIDVDLSLLRKQGSRFFDKDEWMRTLKLKADEFEEIIGCIKFNMNRVVSKKAKEAWEESFEH